jgi:hypothetical protein
MWGIILGAVVGLRWHPLGDPKYENTGGVRGVSGVYSG